MLVKHPLLALLAEKPEKSKDKGLRCPPLPENAREMSNREDFSLMGLMRSPPVFAAHPVATGTAERGLELFAREVP